MPDFSFIKSDGKWFKCNDEVCERITEDKVMSSDAYVLFYERVEKKFHCAEGGIQLMQSDLKLTPNDEKKKMQLDVDDITPTLTITVDSINQSTDSEYSYRQSLSNVNAALQCLVHTESLRKFIISKSTDVLNKQLATAFFEFINAVWIPERNICEPKQAKTSISFKPLFPWIVPLVESTKEEDPKYERYCKICNRLTNFLKTFDIWEMPSTLVVCHDREGYNFKKTKDAKLELTFTLSKFCHREKIRVEYQLYAVIVQLPKTGN
uniref:ubiquitinyl hydrolase 1 n=1 Tax=Amphimedon queenslandica TaxID=400682 RepID=A0A1X7T4U2_AMPQE